MDLASASGITLSGLTSLEQGANTDPRLSTLIKLARTLGVSLDELAAEDVEGPAPKRRPKRKRGK
jgi:transcriptional regulator with XRE-family HTH domain